MTYQLIVPSASRPHLLKDMLFSLLTHVDERPSAIIVHDDGVFPERQHDIPTVLRVMQENFRIPIWAAYDRRPLGHLPSVHRLLEAVTTPYVLYCQDDLLITRPIPARAILAAMDKHGLHQVSFSKRKQRQEDAAGRRNVAVEFDGLAMTVSYHWYFQFGFWRVDQIRPVVAWLATHTNAYHENGEMKTNMALNGQMPELTRALAHADVSIVDPVLDPMDPAVREEYCRTFKFGAYGEPRWFEDMGLRPEDWALPRPGRVVKPEQWR